MKKIEASLTDFLQTVQHDFIGLIAKIEQMRSNMTRLMADRKKSEHILNQERMKQNQKRDIKIQLESSANQNNLN